MPIEFIRYTRGNQKISVNHCVPEGPRSVSCDHGTTPKTGTNGVSTDSMDHLVPFLMMEGLRPHYSTEQLRNTMAVIGFK